MQVQHSHQYVHIFKTLVYLLEPSAALFFTIMGMFSGMKFDFTIYLQLFGYVGELMTGISMVIRLVAQDWTGVFSNDTPVTDKAVDTP